MEKEKLIYEPPKALVVSFDTGDVIATSGDGWLGDDGKPNHDENGWT